MRMHHATRFVHIDAFVQFYHERGVGMLTGWSDAVGVWCVDAHTVGICFEMLFNHLDESEGRLQSLLNPILMWMPGATLLGNEWQSMSSVSSLI